MEAGAAREGRLTAEGSLGLINLKNASAPVLSYPAARWAGTQTVPVVFVSLFCVFPCAEIDNNPPEVVKRTVRPLSFSTQRSRMFYSFCCSFRRVCENIRATALGWRSFLRLIGPGWERERDAFMTAAAFEIRRKALVQNAPKGHMTHGGSPMKHNHRQVIVLITPFLLPRRKKGLQS